MIHDDQNLREPCLSDSFSQVRKETCLVIFNLKQKGVRAGENFHVSSGKSQYSNTPTRHEATAR